MEREELFSSENTSGLWITQYTGIFTYGHNKNDAVCIEIGPMIFQRWKQLKDFDHQDKGVTFRSYFYSQKP